MAYLSFALAFFLSLSSLVWAQNETIGSLPATTPDASSYSRIVNMLRDEDAARCKEMGIGGFAVDGGYHGTAVAYTSPSFSTTAWTNTCERVVAPAVQINYQAAGATSTDLCWLAISSLPTSTTTVDNFTRVGSTKYFVDCTSTARPKEFNESLLLQKVTITAGAITATQRLRPGSAVASTTRVVNVADFEVGGVPMLQVAAGTDQAPAFQAACDELHERDAGVSSTVPGASLLLIPAAEYLINTEVDCDLPDNTTVFAYGAVFNSTADVVMFDINPNADPLDPNGANPAITATLVLQITWLGGWFQNTAATFAQSTAIVAHRMRNFNINAARFTGFRFGILYGGANNYRFQNLFFHNNYKNIAQDQWDQSGAGTIYSIFENIQGNTNQALTRNPQCALCMEGDYYNVVILGGEYSSGSKGAEQASLWFRNNYSPRHITILGVHFEGGSAVNHTTEFAKSIWFDKSGSSGSGFSNVLVEGNSFATAGATAIVAQKCDSCTFRNNSFLQFVEDGGKSLDASDDDNLRIYLSNTNQYRTALPDVYPVALRCLDTVSDFGENVNIESASEVTLPTFCARFINVTGVTPIQSIVGGWFGRFIGLAFQAGGSITSGGNIRTDGPFNAGPLTPGFIDLEYRDNLWKEVSRSRKTRSALIASIGATYTLDTDADQAELTCTDGTACVITMAESTAYIGQVLRIVCLQGSTGTCNFANISNVITIAGGSFNMGTNDTLTLMYISGLRWVELSRSNN